MSRAGKFFGYLDERAEKAGKQRIITLDVYGCRVRFIFAGFEPPEIMLKNLGLFPVMPDEEADENVHVWFDDTGDILDKGGFLPGARYPKYLRGDGHQIILPGTNPRLAVRDTILRRTWVCFENTLPGVPTGYINKPFVNEIQWWTEAKLLLLHGAAVGTGEKGALILAPSGAGKSTLALAGLAAGMDYAADDYVLISKTGKPMAYPVFNTGYITPGSLERIPELKDSILYYVEEKDKYLIDLTPYRDQIKKGINISAIIYPVIGDGSGIAFNNSGSVPRFVQAVRSTAHQISAGDSRKDVFMTLMNRLKDIQSYEMTMGTDPAENAGALKSFLTDNI